MTVRRVAPEDVIFSFNIFKQYSPRHSAYYQHVTKVEKTGEREITFTFDGPGNRELAQIVGEINLLPKHKGFRRAGISRTTRAALRQQGQWRGVGTLPQRGCLDSDPRSAPRILSVIRTAPPSTGLRGAGFRAGSQRQARLP